MSKETIFVSYSRKDKPFVLAFVQELKNQGAKIWIDEFDIELGENWDNAIEEALDQSETIMIIISPTAVESQNVQDEVSVAISSKKKMVPIVITPCELPMRWGRRQYADLASNPDKALNDILHFLGLQEKATSSLKKLLSLIGVSEAPKKVMHKVKEEFTGKEVDQEVTLEDLLVSNAEIDKAINMHKKGIKKYLQMTIITAIISVVLCLLLILFKDSEFLTIDPIYVIIGCLSINLLSVRLYGGKKKRERNIEVLEFLKLKRVRLIRIINTLESSEIDKFNEEFYNRITV